MAIFFLYFKDFRHKIDFNNFRICLKKICTFELCKKAVRFKPLYDQLIQGVPPFPKTYNSIVLYRQGVSGKGNQSGDLLKLKTLYIFIREGVSGYKVVGYRGIPEIT